MLRTLELLALYGAAVASVAFLARALSRPIPLRYLLAMGALSLLLFPDAVIGDRTPLPLDHAMAIPPWSAARVPGPRNPNLNDVALQFLPWTKAVRMDWKAGELPLRDRWNGCGTPLAANGQSGAFSLLTVLGFLLPLAQAFTWLGAAKLLIGATGMWLWVRELGASPRSSLLAAVSFSLSLSMTAWLFFPHTAVICLWPWMLFLIEHGRDAGARKASFPALVACFAVMAAAGHPESLASGVLVATVWILARRLLGLRDAAGLAWRTALAGLTAAGLMAWLLLPELFAVRASNRFASLAHPLWERLLSWIPHGPLWMGGLVTPFFPYTYGDAMSSPTILGAAGAFQEMALGYFGVAGWALALLIFRPGSRRSRDELVLAGIALLGIAGGSGSWPVIEIAARIPGIGMMMPLRFFTWTALAAPVVAAFELDRYERDACNRRRPWLALWIVAAILGVLALATWRAHRDLHEAAGGLGFQIRQLALVAVILAAVGIGAAALRGRPGAFAGLMILLCGGELLLEARRLYGVHPAGWLYPEVPVLAFLHRQPGTFRVLGERSILFPNTNVFAGLEDIRTHDPVERRDYVEFLDATCGYDANDYFKQLRNVDSPVLEFLNVRYLLADAGAEAPGPKWKPVHSDSDWTVFENASVLPRAFAPAAIRFVAPVAAASTSNAMQRFGPEFRGAVPTLDWRAVAYLLSERDRGESANGPVEISAYGEGTNTATFRAAAPAEGRAFVVLSLTQDGGWAARDEAGRVLPVSLANGPFLAVELPPGRHTIRLRYWPPGFRAGVGIALATLGLAGILARGRRRIA